MYEPMIGWVVSLLVLAVLATGRVWSELLLPEVAGEATSNAWLALGVAAYLAWSGRGSLRFSGQYNRVGVVVLSLGAALLFTGHVVLSSTLARVAAVMIVWGTVASFATRNCLNTLLRIGFALLFAITVPTAIGGLVTERLASVNAWLVGKLLSYFGHPNEVLGTLVSAGELQLQVVDACDGLRLLWAVLLLAFAQLVSKRASFRTFAVVLGVAPALTVVLNTVRVLTASLLFAKVPETAADYVHDVTGVTMMACAWMVPWLLISRLEGTSKAGNASRSSVSGAAQTDAGLGSWYTWRPIALASMLVLTLAIQLTIATPKDPPDFDSTAFASRLSKAIPFRVGDFVGVEQPIPKRQLEVLRPDASLGRRYEGNTAANEFLFIVSLHNDASGQDGHQVERCYGNIGWKIAKRSSGRKTEASYVLDTTACALIRERKKQTEEMFVFKGSIRDDEGDHLTMPLTQFQIVFSSEISASTRTRVIRELTELVCGEYEEHLGLVNQTRLRSSG